MRADARGRSEKATEGIRTLDRCLTKAPADSITNVANHTCDGKDSPVSSRRSSSRASRCETVPHTAAVIDALETMPAAERPAIVAHLRALAAMTANRRAAVLTLTAATGGGDESRS